MTIVVNIPLFLFALRKMGASFFIKTAVATVVSSLAIDLFAFLPHYTEDRLLATIFGGVMQARAFRLSTCAVLRQVAATYFPH